MYTLAWPWLLALLPLPWLLRWWLKPAPAASGAALRLPLLDLLPIDRQAANMRSSVLRGLLMALAWAALLLACARPQWVGEPLSLPRSGRDLLMAVDVSGSMQQQDMEIGGRRLDRLSAVQVIAGDFIERREGDRIGLILFGQRAYLMTPLSFDRKTVSNQLAEAVIGLAGRETAIGDAIGLAVKRLRERPENQRVMILLTDGANTAGEVAPLKAAELAAREKVRIYTIGVGAEEMVVNSFFGQRRVNPSADLDEPTMRAIADLTGGKYFRARDTGELAQIYREIDAMEPVESDPETFRPEHELFHWPMGLAALIMGLLLAPIRKLQWT